MIRPCLVLLAFAAPLAAQAAPPVLEGFFPPGGQTGSTFTLTAIGKVEDDARLWTDCPGLYLVPTGKKREWQATVRPEAPPGLHLIRAWNAEGASAARWFSIGSLPEIAEVEPNDEVGKAQPLAKLPVTLNARLDKSGDVDGYAVTLKEGQTLLAVVEAYTLGSPVDMVAHILNEEGVRILTASDSRNLDPVILFKAPAAGAYTVQLAGFVHPPQADVRFTGGGAVVYRLHLSTGPVVTSAAPAVVSSSAKTEIELRGLGLESKTARHTLSPLPGRAVGEIVSLPVPHALQPPQFVVSERAPVVEKEPNNSPADAMPLKLGDSACGTLGPKDSADLYSVSVKKGDKLRLRVVAQQIGSALDPVLEVRDPSGKSILNQDDTGDVSDPTTDWTVPADGAYHITITDRFAKGGDGFHYVLQVLSAVPDFTVAINDGKPLIIEPGKTASLKATVKFSGGFKEPLVLRMAQLPAGLHAPDVPVPAKGGEVEVTIHAAPSAQPWSGPLSLAVWSQEPVHFKAAQYPLRGDSLRGTSPLDRSEALWLTVRAK